jgi:DNA-binding NtrC family response regulator
MKLPPKANMSLPERKQKTKILFIDDDTKFKVAKILANSGWINTAIIKDANTLDEPSILDAHILFVDVQGVGVKMSFDSEGLGLALALKEKYPQKKIIIYSAETKGDRFHAALRKADSFLPKNADPYEFQKLVEELSSDLDFS